MCVGLVGGVEAAEARHEIGKSIDVGMSAAAVGRKDASKEEEGADDAVGDGHGYGWDDSSTAKAPRWLLLG